MHVDPITRRTIDYATPTTCENNPKNNIELDPDSDDQDFYILGPEPIKRKPPVMFTPSQSKTTIRHNTFTAQDAGIYSNTELDQFWNRIPFSKHSDTTLQLLGKSLSYSFISSNTSNYDANSPYENPYNTLRIVLHDKLTSLFTPTWFSDAFIALFGYPCYILTLKEQTPNIFNSSIGATKKIILSLQFISQLYNFCTPFLDFLIRYLFVRHTVSPPLSIAYRF